MPKVKLYLICELPAEHFSLWDDGLRAALRVLVDKYNYSVHIFNLTPGEAIPDDADFYLFWGALERKQHGRRFFPKQGLCFAGGPTNNLNINNFDVIFAESQEDFDSFKEKGVNVVKAFGTNTKLFKPLNYPKVIDYLYPAAFALWKNHFKFVDYVKSHKVDKRLPIALAVGYKQPDGVDKECYEVCEKNGVLTMSWVSPEVLLTLYNLSKNVLITGDKDGGCQRVVLEGKACGIPVIIESDSPKLLELKDLTREDVLRDWSETAYAEKLKEGIEGVL